MATDSSGSYQGFLTTRLLPYDGIPVFQAQGRGPQTSLFLDRPSARREQRKAEGDISRPESAKNPNGMTSKTEMNMVRIT